VLFDLRNSFCHIEIPVKDLEKARKFYSELFGWEIELHPEVDYGLIATPNPPGGGLMKVEEEVEIGIIPYVYVEDIDAVLERIKELGGEIIQEKTAVEEGKSWFALFTDLDGNLLGLYTEIEEEEEEGAEEEEEK